MSQAKGDNTSIVNAATVRPVTRRNLIAGGTAALALAGAALPSQALNTDTEADPVVILWRKFQPAQDEQRRLFAQCEMIEDGLPDHPGVSCGMILAIVPAGMSPVGAPQIARLDEQIEEFATKLMTGFDDATRSAWIAERKAKLVEVNRQMEEAERASGLTDLREEQRRHSQVADDAYGEIAKTAATTPAGIAAKILMAFEFADDGMIEDLPHCLNVDALRDLLPSCPSDLAERIRWFTEAIERTGNRAAMISDCLDQAYSIAEGTAVS